MKGIRISYRRKREGKTDYGKRLKLVMSNKLRFVVRKSNRNILIQLTQFSPKGDKVLVSAHTNELRKFGWKAAKRNMPAAYLLGMLVALKAKKKKINEAVLDIGLYPSIGGSLLYAALNGAVDKGLIIQHDKKILPKQERIEGKHITLNKKTKYTKFDPATITKHFAEVKNKILKNA